MKHVAFDPSGNFKEGKGTTGICISVDSVQKELKEINAEDYSSAEAYWDAHVELIEKECPDHVTIEGYRLYNHKGKEAKMQANSELETPQLIGLLKHTCWRLAIPYNIQSASEAKTRWQEAILVTLGHLEAKSGRYYFKGKLTNTHKRDSLKHSLHWWRYKHEA